jgi:hypothetical protein
MNVTRSPVVSNQTINWYNLLLNCISIVKPNNSDPESLKIMYISGPTMLFSMSMVKYAH